MLILLPPSLPQVISRICSVESQFILVLTCLIQVFEEDRNLLESRGSLIIRRLCGNLDCILIFQTLAQILTTNKDVDFISVFVQILNLILLTAPELSPLRSYLQKRDIEPRGTSSSLSIPHLLVTQQTLTPFPHPIPMTCSSLSSTVGPILLWQHSHSVFTLKDMISLLIWWHALLLLKSQSTS